ncbi:SDR family oxidoreductase [Candidatus Woesearchaeota archaeon]|nr:SDR family oxidoreductase [Candidatus Woesearchaeota archaeon]
MKALILGGTSGLGLGIVTSLEKKGYHPITLSRQKIDSVSHYKCDLGDIGTSLEAFSRIKRDHSSLDLIVCVAGYVSPTNLENQTSEVYDQHIIRNLGYVDLAFDFFKEVLRDVSHPVFVTIGSRWSLKTGCTELLPYIAAKHALRLFTQQKARINPWLKINNYCVPQMHTPASLDVRKKLLEINPYKKQKVFDKDLADPTAIASSLITHLLDYDNKSGVYSIHQTGKIIRNGNKP